MASVICWRPASAAIALVPDWMVPSATRSARGTTTAVRRREKPRALAVASATAARRRPCPRPAAHAAPRATTAGPASATAVMSKMADIAPIAAPIIPGTKSGVTTDASPAAPQIHALTMRPAPRVLLSTAAAPTAAVGLRRAISRAASRLATKAAGSNSAALTMSGHTESTGVKSASTMPLRRSSGTRAYAQPYPATAPVTTARLATTITSRVTSERTWRESAPTARSRAKSRRRSRSAPATAVETTNVAIMTATPPKDVIIAGSMVAVGEKRSSA